MSLENMPDEKGSHEIPHILVQFIGNVQSKKKDLCRNKSQRFGGMESGSKVSFREYKNVLKSECGNGCTTLCIC